MPQFEYVAVDAGGARVQGRTFATGLLELDRLLEGRGLTVTTAKTTERPASAGGLRLSRDELVSFTTQLATLISAGVPLVQGLENLAERAAGTRLGALLKTMVEDLRGGMTLSEAMHRHPAAFPDVFLASVRAGELSGDLPSVLKRMAAYLDWVRSIRSTTVQALVYPFLLSLAILGLIVVLLTWLLPRILSLFPGGTADLPLQTRVVIAISDFLTGNALLLGGLGVGLAATLLAIRKRPRVRRTWGRVMLAIPRLGTVVRMLATSKFASTSLTLYKAGCDVVETIRVAGQTCGNAYLAAAFERAADGVHSGLTITEGLELEPQMDPLLLQVTAVGEQSGTLDDSLESLVDFYDQEVPRTVKWFLSFFEPMILLVAGFVVAFILMAALLPIFALYENIS